MLKPGLTATPGGDIGWTTPKFHPPRRRPPSWSGNAKHRKTSCADERCRASRGGGVVALVQRRTRRGGVVWVEWLRDELSAGSSVREDTVSTEDNNKAVVGRWFQEFWGADFNAAIIDELAAPDIRFEYSLHAPCSGRNEVRAFAEKFRAAFPDLAFEGRADLIADGDYVVGQWVGGGTHTGDAFDDMPISALPAATGNKMWFTGISVLKVENGLITEELGIDDGVTALQQLGLIKAA
jgi:predicted ester cyclase